MAKATGLISSLFDVASFQDMPFQQPQLASWFYQSLPLFSIPFSTTVQVMICGMRIMASVQDFGKCRAIYSRGASYTIGSLECYPKCLKQLETKYSDTPWLSGTPII